MPTAKRPDPNRDRTDWAHLRAMPDDEVERIAAADTDNPATASDDEWAEAFVGLPPARVSVHATFDGDVVAFFKRGGKGYQSRMNAVLRQYMERRLSEDPKS
ncbi:BrnA antitoxin family protein [Methylobacterium sp. J-076]|uniref:BrnA antitoxin family protein n=1 Tax=Methylobacterium sp. J-076 TaxID=2836655 RepID=UPI001FBAC51E|nr:BrnA antitoxin family protein [Methylobacterium sp. J-076]MCJ2014217.1 BrnA antitoxin family protein [Methylobacterium sp. J-076]